LQSELHKRLSHLVQYSSGLIFIKSEPSFSVSSCVDALLAEQEDSDEVAVITAKPNVMLSDFRQQLCQQLASKFAPHSGDAPLAKLLAPSVGHIESSPTQGLLICISKGENLSPRMLEELQQLVLTLHAGSERQVNVLIFGEQQWVNNTYKTIGHDQKHNVIVVDAGAAIEPTAGISGSELEQLIANKRQAFAQRVEQRNQAESTEPSNMMRRPWFIPLISVLFILIFSTILLSQYPELLGDNIDEKMDNPALSQNEIKSVNSSEGNASEPAASVNTQKPVTQTIAPHPTPGIDDIQKPASSASATERAPTGDALISNWQSETKRIDTQQDKATELTSRSNSDTASQTISTPAEDAGSGQEQNPLQVTSSNGTLPEKSEIIEVRSTEHSTEASYEFDEAEILALPKEGYILQVIGFSIRSAIQNYINSNNLQQHVWVYQTIRSNKAWYVLVYNKYYSSLPEASQDVSSLPNGLHEATPFPKSLEKVHQEIEFTN
jgi:DamX protein